MKPGDVLRKHTGPLVTVLIAEGDVAFVDDGTRVCRFQKTSRGRYERDFFSLETLTLEHEELLHRE